MFLKFSNNKFVSKKTQSLIHLSEEKLPIPPTIFFSPEQRNRVADYIKSWPYDFLYVRMIFSDSKYPHYFCSLCKKDNFTHQLEQLLNKGSKHSIEKFDLIIQPLLAFKWSGGLLCQKSFNLLEIVSGAPNILFRDGQFLHRYLIDNSMKIVESEDGIQEKSLQWNGFKWTDTSNFKIEDTLDFTFLRFIKHKKNRLYEIGSDGFSVYFLEYKDLSVTFCPHLSITGLKKPLIVNEIHGISKTRHYEIEAPVFDYLAEIQKKKIDSVMIKQGALLSHLTVFLAQNQIPTKIIK